MQIADWTFEAGPQSAAQARTAVVGSLYVWEAPREIALLLTSELVANAVLHGSGAVGVRMAWGEGGLRVEVKDSSPELPVVRGWTPRPRTGEDSAWWTGLSSDWGVSVGATGKTVWFSLLADDSPCSGSAGWFTPPPPE